MQHPAGNAVSGFVQRGCETEECMKELDRELDYRKMGMRIRQVRKTRGWSQDALAKKMRHQHVISGPYRAGDQDYEPGDVCKYLYGAGG